MARSDLDWISIDMDHGSIDIGTTEAMIAATTGTQLVPFVSVVSAWQAELPLDIGALGSTFRAARFPAIDRSSTVCMHMFGTTERHQVPLNPAPDANTRGR
jgi:hypothetical protein